MYQLDIIEVTFAFGFICTKTIVMAAFQDDCDQFTRLYISGFMLDLNNGPALMQS